MPATGWSSLTGRPATARATRFSGSARSRCGDRMRRSTGALGTVRQELPVNATRRSRHPHRPRDDAADDFGVSEDATAWRRVSTRSVRAAGAIRSTHAANDVAAAFSDSRSLARWRRIRARPAAPISTRSTSAAGRYPDDRATARRRHVGRGVIGRQIAVDLSPLGSRPTRSISQSRSAQGMTVIVVDGSAHVARTTTSTPPLAWRIRLLERRQEVRLVRTTAGFRSCR